MTHHIESFCVKPPAGPGGGPGMRFIDEWEGSIGHGRFIVLCLNGLVPKLPLPAKMVRVTEGRGGEPAVFFEGGMGGDGHITPASYSLMVGGPTPFGGGFVHGASHATPNPLLPYFFNRELTAAEKMMAQRLAQRLEDYRRHLANANRLCLRMQNCQPLPVPAEFQAQDSQAHDWSI